MNLLPPDFNEGNIDHDEFVSKLNIEIHCKGVALKHDYQLKYVFEKYWEYDDLLTLYYRNKAPEIEENNSKMRECLKISIQPPVWIPDYIAYNCYQCDIEFSLFIRIHHCRSCGK